MTLNCISCLLDREHTEKSGFGHTTCKLWTPNSIISDSYFSPVGRERCPVWDFCCKWAAVQAGPGKGGSSSTPQPHLIGFFYTPTSGLDSKCRGTLKHSLSYLFLLEIYFYLPNSYFLFGSQLKAQRGLSWPFRLDSLWISHGQKPPCSSLVLSA